MKSQAYNRNATHVRATTEKHMTSKRMSTTRTCVERNPATHTYTHNPHQEQYYTKQYYSTLAQPRQFNLTQNSHLMQYTMHTQHQSLPAPLTGCHRASMSLQIRQAHIHAHHACTQHIIKTREKPNVGNITQVTFCRSCANMRSCAKSIIS